MGRHIEWLLGGLLMLLLAGCASDPKEETEPEPKQKPVLTIWLYAPDRPVVTRGDIGEVDALVAESAVHSLHIWVFEAGTDTHVGHISLSEPNMEEVLDDQDTNIVGKKVTMEISDDFAKKLTNDNSDDDKVDIYVAANVTPYNCGLSLDGSTTRANLEAALIEHKADGADYFGVTGLASMTSGVMKVPDSGLPMSGVLKGQTVGGTSPVFNVMTRVKLVRAVSKIRFIFSKSTSISNDTHLRVKSVSLGDNTASVLPKQQYLFLEGSYPDYEKRVKTDGGYEAETNVITDVGFSAINDCSNLSQYIYDSESMNGQDYETLINKGLITQDGQTSPDLSELGRFYLRESDKTLRGRIKYTMLDDEEKEATFQMKTAGDFSRNHTWIVYAYFVGTDELEVNVVEVKAWNEETSSHSVYNW